MRFDDDELYKFRTELSVTHGLSVRAIYGLLNRLEEMELPLTLENAIAASVKTTPKLHNIGRVTEAELLRFGALHGKNVPRADFQLTAPSRQIRALSLILETSDISEIHALARDALLRLKPLSRRKCNECDNTALPGSNFCSEKCRNVKTTARKDRNLEIHARIKAGETLQAVGNDYGLSRERVRQIAARIDRIKSFNPNHSALRKIA